MRQPLLPSALAAVALCACVDATVIGGDQFDDERLPVTFTDTVALTLSTERAPAATLATALRGDGVPGAYAGCLASGLTGATTATLGLELVEEAAPRLDLGAVRVDSMVLVLPLAPALAVGDTTAAVGLRVEAAAAGSIRLAEATFADSLSGTGITYGTFAGVPAREPVVVEATVGSTVLTDTVTPQLRIRLNAAFEADVAEALRRRSPADTVPDDSLFVGAFPGILLRGGDCSRQLPAVSLAVADAPQFGVSIYYTRDTARGIYRLVNRRLTEQGNAFAAGTTQARVAYGHDYAGSTADTLLAGGSGRETAAAVQGLQGLNIAVGFPDISTFGDRRGVTFAELLLPVAPSAPTPVTPSERLVLRVRNASGDLIPYSADPRASGSGGFSTSEGGLLERIPDPRGGGDSVAAYRFNITSLFQEFVSGEREPVVFVTPLATELVAGESALVGPDGDGLRASLRVASAELP